MFYHYMCSVYGLLDIFDQLHCSERAIDNSVPVVFDGINGLAPLYFDDNF